LKGSLQKFKKGKHQKKKSETTLTQEVKMKGRAKNKAKGTSVYDGNGIDPAVIKRVKAFLDSIEFVGVEDDGEPDPSTELTEEEEEAMEEANEQAETTDEELEAAIQNLFAGTTFEEARRVYPEPVRAPVPAADGRDEQGREQED
jgi:hypothetical protein